MRPYLVPGQLLNNPRYTMPTQDKNWIYNIENGRLVVREDYFRVRFRTIISLYLLHLLFYL